MAAGDWRTDAALVIAFRKGDSTAGESLLARWFRPALAAAEEVIGHRPSATQVVTDTFQACFEELGDLDDPRRFGRWLLEACRQRAREEITARPGRAVLTGKPELTSLFSSIPDLQEAVARVLVRRGVLADGEAPPPSSPPIGAPAPAGAPASAPPRYLAPEAEVQPESDEAGLVSLANTEHLAARLHRYDAAAGGPEPGTWRRRVRVSAGSGVGLAVVAMGSLLWLIGRNDPSSAAGQRTYTVQAPQPEAAVGIAPAQSTVLDPSLALAPGAVVGGAAGAEIVPGNPLAPQIPALQRGSGRRSNTAGPAPAPATQPPATARPTTTPTVPPTQPPATQPPATQPPATQPPTTAKPTTTTTTAAPTTTTAKPTTTTTAKVTTTTAAPTTTTARPTTTTTARVTTTTAAPTTTTAKNNGKGSG